ncbi:hypothetical protein PPL_11245 [Heterostelium album PN500]|uniref:Uncharacterized protein n=1 Tax=Heterostelium pallidum (strain ATCC 26659 / Pp 5 / PN500) TaxID=670386 RepID=D3BTY5_HETP5|nr:hypothetical protein PPL_11245 [Heterostelium album PN500]EFA75171.1 hypothetical protein PPL_11245 [Heterostelium album PN500]|eukprot:XP_020427305.1 hypothetical protein PPL_11245 [Heterostelium album PN500]
MLKSSFQKTNNIHVEWYEFELAIFKIREAPIRDWLMYRLQTINAIFDDDFRKGREEAIKREKQHLAREIKLHLEEEEYIAPLSQWLTK